MCISFCRLSSNCWPSRDISSSTAPALPPRVRSTNQPHNTLFLISNVSETASMATSSSGQLDTVMHETRLFPPSREFSSRARIKSLEEYQEIWDEAAADPTAFWSKLAKDELHWFQPFTKALEWQ